MKPTRQFWLGMLAGLTAAGLLRRINAEGFSLESIQRVYGVWAAHYWFANVYFLGQLPRMRRTAVERLELQPGDHVLDICCGTGANLSYVEARIGPTGRIVAVDFTHEMLAEAKKRVEVQGWHNIELIQADVARLNLDRQFDGALWTLAPSLVPDWEHALERAVAHLKPGGWLVLADARFSQHWYSEPFNWFADLLAVGAAADIGRRPWALMPQYLEKIGYEELLLGFLYLTWGQKAASAAGAQHALNSR